MKLDEHPKPKTTIEQLAKLPPVFKKGGVVTAGGASGIQLMSKRDDSRKKVGQVYQISREKYKLVLQYIQLVYYVTFIYRSLVEKNIC